MQTKTNAEMFISRDGATFKGQGLQFRIKAKALW